MNNGVNVLIYFICQCHRNEADTNLWDSDVEEDVSDSELNVASSFSCRGPVSNEAQHP